MNLENILNNDDNKLIFLKAVMLGINYGKSENSAYYIENIEREIKKISNKREMEELNKNNKVFDKYEKNLLFLDSQKNHTLNMIHKLSSNNYGYNYSKINLLKTNLNLIMIEIEKNKVAIKKNQENIKDKVSQNTPSTIKPLKPIKQSNNSINNNSNNNSNNNTTKKHEENNSMVGELEKTLINLSKLII